MKETSALAAGASALQGGLEHQRSITREGNEAPACASRAASASPMPLKSADLCCKFADMDLAAVSNGDASSSDLPLHGSHAATSKVRTAQVLPACRAALAFCVAVALCNMGNVSHLEMVVRLIRC